MNTTAIQITIGGAVQGVGYRPFVYRVAGETGVAGSVRNTPAGVRIHAQGETDRVRAFVSRIRATHPPLAVIASVETAPAVFDPLITAFAIQASIAGEQSAVEIMRDIAPCQNCLCEMRDPSDRRFRHPFINCTDCGPRFSIIRSLPYDRERTAMSHFAMCDRCAAEFRDPSNRRFHAQPVCCNECGPRLTLANGAGAVMPVADAVGEAAAMLAEGKIIAVKGLGGFHLACRADSDGAVARLRQRKHREEKPLAVMLASAEAAGRFAAVSPAERVMLESAERPIVILDKKENGAPVAPSVAPRVATLGLMLPSTPLHHLLFDAGGFEALVMTSGNMSDEPVICDNAEAVRRLTGVADAFLMHDRPIHVRVDDSIVRLRGSYPAMMRRARGFVPSKIAVAGDVDGVVGLGGIMKSTVAVGRGSCCYVSQYLGSAESAATIDNCNFSLCHFMSILGVTPRICAADLHPAGPDAAALGLAGVPRVGVQHHHAHAVACMAENNIRGRAVCVVYDGLGLGVDGAMWGGEILVAGYSRFSRPAHLAYMPMPGGDMAAQYPGRMALAALYGIMGERSREALPWMDAREHDAVVSMVSQDVHCPRTSSMGRLFDAAAAILDICRKRTYEGQPAIELEAAADAGEAGVYETASMADGATMLMNGAKLLADVREDADAGTPVATAAAKFHNTVAVFTVHAARFAANMAGAETVCLCGGCFQNRLLTRRVMDGLRKEGLTPVCHRLLPPTDESIALGQVVAASAMAEECLAAAPNPPRHL